MARSSSSFQAGVLHPNYKGHYTILEAADRFWSHVDVRGEDDCWEWQAYRGPKGYGQFGISGGKLKKAHCVAWALAHGGEFTTECVLHSCDNPPCCNVAHLFIGDRPLNNLDMRNKGRQSVGPRHAEKTRGSLHGMHKLTDEEVLMIHELLSLGKATGVQLAQEFGVHVATISGINTGRIWSHLTGKLHPRKR